MCGIWALFGYDLTKNQVRRSKAFESAFKVACRGPDCFQMQSISAVRNSYLAFHRLCVVDETRGMQPMNLLQYPHLFLICNGEIYNFETLKRTFEFSFESSCDCEVILHLYAKFGYEKTAQLLDGIFSFVLVDTKDKKIVLARDSFGIKPMFYFIDKINHSLGVCSEMKGLIDLLNVNGEQNGPDSIVQLHHPGHVMVFDLSDSGKVDLKETKQFHTFENKPLHQTYHELEIKEGLDINNVRSNVRTLLMKAVEKRLITHREIGCLLSGSVDSSLIASIAAKKLKEKCNQRLKTFTIGLDPASQDMIAARKVAKHIGSEHYEVIIQLEDIFSAMDQVLYQTETFDVISVNACVASWLLSKYIRENTDVRVVMSGDGSDELTQGYSYFHHQPRPEDGDKESKRLLKDLHYYDVLRVDRCTAAHGLESLVPFLDHAFAAYYLSLPAELRCPKNGWEKNLLRSSFEGTNILPEEILWRKKVGFGAALTDNKEVWTQTNEYRQFFDNKVSDEDMKNAKSMYRKSPSSKEELYYRRIFEQIFGGKHEHLTPYQWTPKWINNNDYRIVA